MILYELVKYIFHILWHVQEIKLQLKFIIVFTKVYTQSSLSTHTSIWHCKMFNLLVTLLCISLIDSHTFEEKGKSDLLVICTFNHLTFSASPTLPLDVLREYLTPLGPGVKEACVNASERYLALLNVRCSFSLMFVGSDRSSRSHNLRSFVRWKFV